MRRFLIVGCGGSGGATLSYMMDQLRSDLASHGIDDIPAGWKFVHIDVPSGSENGPEGLPSVEAQGGSYFGSGPQGTSYSMLDSALSQRLGSMLDTTATWAPREPDQVPIPISAGAGQYRAIGRMITLSKAGDIHARLQNAWNQLTHDSTRSEMTNLTLPGLGGYNPNDPPLVLVVSSMAGGAGASMALDICRLLTLVEGLDPKLMGVFMVTPDIFDGLPAGARTGVRANALAMLGEIVASQTGSARRHDVRTLAGLGLANGEGETIPFARVFPVGRKVGAEGAIFGDGSQNAVYRGLARGLAGLMMSGKATDQFVSYDLGNTGSPDGNRNYLGWGNRLWDPLPWGSYGFSSLSMGRDRYAEYSSQRLARASVDKLLHGHLQKGNPASSVEQATALLDSQWANVLMSIGLPLIGAGAQGQGVGQWLATVAMDRQAADALVANVIDTQLRPFLPQPVGMNAGQWVPMLRHAVRGRRDAMNQTIQAGAYNWAFTWHQEFADRCVSAAGDAISSVGLPYAIALIERVRAYLSDVILPGTRDLTTHADGDVSAIPQDVEPTLGMLKKTIPNGTQIVDRVIGSYPTAVRTHLYARGAGYVSQASAAITTEVLTPLLDAMSEAQRLLENATSEKISDLGLARLATNQYVAWPSDSDERVHARFSEANNEVLLTNSSHFKGQYESVDLPRAVSDAAAVATFVDSVPMAGKQVISGLWATTGGHRPPGGLIEQTAMWRSRAFTIDPHSGEPRQPSLAQFNVHCRPAELVDRARQFVARPGESFDRFVRVSLRDYVQGIDAPESELAQRRNSISIKFAEALSLARPLATVSDEALRVLHGTQLEYRYKYSAIPFGGISVGEDLARILESNPRIDQATKDNFKSSLTDESGLTKIDIFGSYPNYSPLAFSSVLKPVAEQWAQTSEQGRESFWRYRRARPLDAALPMADEERRTMTAGWFLGQMVGRIQIPDAPFDQPVQIWDAAQSRWLNFPHPLLTPPRRFVASYDWLPAVMESILVAFAQSHQSPAMSSLQPYHVLRGLYDSTSDDPASGLLDVSATALLVPWLATGVTEGGKPSRVSAAVEATDVEQRAAAAIGWLSTVRDLAGDHFVEAGVNGARGGGQFSIINSRQLASSTPIFRDLAPDVLWATTELIAIVNKSKEAADRAVLNQSNPAFGASVGSSGLGAVSISMPEGGTF
nr:tubulin-like doman-containing protein [Rhodococcus sp. (in: high G+C Gram-positive bacteria)]